MSFGESRPGACSLITVRRAPNGAWISQILDVAIANVLIWEFEVMGGGEDGLRYKTAEFELFPYNYLPENSNLIGGLATMAACPDREVLEYLPGPFAMGGGDFNRNQPTTTQDMQVQSGGSLRPARSWSNARSWEANLTNGRPTKYDEG